MSFSNKELEDWPVTEPPTEAEVGRGRSRAVELGGQSYGVPHSARSTFFDMFVPPVEGKLWVPMVKQNTNPVQILLTSCDQYALFSLPLEYKKGWQGTFPTENQEDANVTKMCVVDDAAHLWPRFQ